MMGFYSEATNFLSALLSTVVVTLMLERASHALPKAADEVAAGSLVVLSTCLHWAWNAGHMPAEYWPWLMPVAVAMFRVPRSCDVVTALFLLFNAFMMARLVYLMRGSIELVGV
jgi:hypothetical protein